MVDKTLEGCISTDDEYVYFFLFYNSKVDESCRTSHEGYKQLSNTLSKPYALGCFNLEELDCNEEEIYEHIVSSKALFHKSCYSKYNKCLSNMVLCRVL